MVFMVFMVLWVEGYLLCVMCYVLCVDSVIGYGLCVEGYVLCVMC